MVTGTLCRALTTWVEVLRRCIYIWKQNLWAQGTETIISMDKVVEPGQLVLRDCLGLEEPHLYFKAFGSAFYKLCANYCPCSNLKICTINGTWIHVFFVVWVWKWVMRLKVIIFYTVEVNILRCLKCFRSYFSINLPNPEVMPNIRVFASPKLFSIFRTWPVKLQRRIVIKGTI